MKRYFLMFCLLFAVTTQVGCLEPTGSLSDGSSGDDSTSGTGGSSATGGTSGSSGTSGSGGSSATGGTSGSSGTSNTGGTAGTGGSSDTGGTAGTGGSTKDPNFCDPVGSWKWCYDCPDNAEGKRFCEESNLFSETCTCPDPQGTDGTSGSGGTAGTGGTSGSGGTSGTGGTSGSGGTGGSVSDCNSGTDRDCSAKCPSGFTGTEQCIDERWSGMCVCEKLEECVSGQVRDCSSYCQPGYQGVEECDAGFWTGTCLCGSQGTGGTGGASGTGGTSGSGGTAGTGGTSGTGGSSGTGGTAGTGGEETGGSGGTAGTGGSQDCELQTFYRDADGDGWGVKEITTQACEQPSGFATKFGDCNDADPNINPDAVEIMNNDIDENCDGKAEWEPLLTCYLRHPDGLAHKYYILGYEVDQESQNPVTWGSFLGTSATTQNVYWARFSVRIKEGSRFEWNAAADPANLNPETAEFWKFSAITSTKQYGAPIHKMNTYCHVEIDGIVTWTVPPYAKDNGQGWYNLEVRAEPSHLISLADKDGDGYTVADGDCNDNDPRIRPGAVEIWGDNEDQNCNGKDPFATVVVTLCGPGEYTHPKPVLWEVMSKWQPHTMVWSGCFEKSFVGYYTPRQFYFEWGNPKEWDNSYWGEVCHELSNVSARGYGFGQTVSTPIQVSLSKVPGQDTCHRYISEEKLTN